MQFEFNNQLVPQNLIDVDEIGSFGLEAISEDGFYYYLVIQTYQGMSIIGTCGPLIPDTDILVSSFSTSIAKIPYKEDKISKFINGFLNDKYKNIVEAKIIDVEDAIDQFKDTKDYLRNIQNI